MTIEQYLFHLHATRFLLIAESLSTGDVRGAQLLRRWHDIRVCCSPNHHRPEWRYAGGGKYVCSVCERIAV